MVAEALRRVPLFHGLLDSELEAIACQVAVSRYDGGQIVFSEGDPGGDLLVVQRGSVRVEKMALSGRRQLISIERAGSSLGEVSVFDGGSYSATATAMEPTVVLRLRGDKFRALCLANPAIGFQVIRVLGQRLRHLRALVEKLSFATVRDRLILHLLQLAQEVGTADGNGIRIVLTENHEELAGRLGTVRELVSRNLGRLHGEGLIVMGKRMVSIPDLGLLRAELSS